MSPPTPTLSLTLFPPLYTSMNFFNASVLPHDAASNPSSQHNNLICHLSVNLRMVQQWCSFQPYHGWYVYEPYRHGIMAGNFP